MEARLLGNLVEPQSAGPASPTEEALISLAAPPKAISRVYPGAPQQDGDSDIERPRLSRHQRTTSYGSGAATPRTAAELDDLEMSRPATPVPEEEVVDAKQSVWHPSMNRFRLLSVCLANFGNALNDGAAGALLPYMEKYYHIGYAVVSLIFVGQALGFVFAAIFLDDLRARLGRAKLLGLGQGLMTLAFIPLVANAPFVLIVFSLFFIGFGIALNLATGNVFCGTLQNQTIMLGLMHGSYGLGGTVAPLIATAIVTVADAIWSRYYFLTLGVTAVSLVLSVWSFWGYEKESGPAFRARERPDANAALVGMFIALKLPVVLLGATFIFAYQGAEVSISGWVISFLINVRDGDPSSVGYVTAGFWGGITLGRFFLSPLSSKIGEKLFVYGLVLGAAAFQLLVWLVPNIIGNAVAVAIVGLLLGPIYPCAAAVFMRSMSRREAMSGMGTISACGSLGGAVAPFLTGLVAQAAGTFVLHPIAIGLFVVMLICWYKMPYEPKRKD